MIFFIYSVYIFVFFASLKCSLINYNYDSKHFLLYNNVTDCAKSNLSTGSFQNSGEY